MSSVEVNPHDRKFGVEIECGGLDWEGAYNLFDAHDDDEDPDYDHWSVGEDGTAVEVRTPILQGEAGFETLRWAMQHLVKNGAYVTEMDGMHVHHDAPEFVDNPELCVHLVRSWRNNEQAIHNLVAPRRRNAEPCPSWSNDRFGILETWAKGEGSLYVGRYDLNIAALANHGSVEIRLHEGTLDPAVAISWIQFGQRFLHRVLEEASALPAGHSDMDLLSRIQLSAEAVAILEAKRNAGHDTLASQFQEYQDSSDYDPY